MTELINDKKEYSIRPTDTDSVGFLFVGKDGRSKPLPYKKHTAAYRCDSNARHIASEAIALSN